MPPPLPPPPSLPSAALLSPSPSPHPKGTQAQQQKSSKETRNTDRKTRSAAATAGEPAAEREQAVTGADVDDLDDLGGGGGSDDADGEAEAAEMRRKARRLYPAGQPAATVARPIRSPQDRARDEREEAAAEKVVGCEGGAGASGCGEEHSSGLDADGEVAATATAAKLPVKVEGDADAQAGDTVRSCVGRDVDNPDRHRGGEHDGAISQTIVSEPAGGGEAGHRGRNDVAAAGGGTEDRTQGKRDRESGGEAAADVVGTDVDGAISGSTGRAGEVTQRGDTSVDENMMRKRCRSDDGGTADVADRSAVGMEKDDNSDDGCGGREVGTGEDNEEANDEAEERRRGKIVAGSAAVMADADQAVAVFKAQQAAVEAMALEERALAAAAKEEGRLDDELEVDVSFGLQARVWVMAHGDTDERRGQDRVPYPYRT